MNKILHEDLSLVKKLAQLVSKLLSEEQEKRASESVIVMQSHHGRDHGVLAHA
jgi:hypothetical protein